jgi:hypothetical protein
MSPKFFLFCVENSNVIMKKYKHLLIAMNMMLGVSINAQTQSLKEVL